VAAGKHSDRKVSESSHGEPSLRGASFLEPGSVGGAPVLTEHQRQQLLEIATRVRVPARSVVYREQTAANWIYINTEGVLKTFKDLRSGRRWVTAFLFPKDVFGLAKKRRRPGDGENRADLYGLLRPYGLTEQADCAGRDKNFNC